MHVRFASGLAEIHLPSFIFSCRKASRLAFQKAILDRKEMELRKAGKNMGIFDPDEVITIYSLKQAIEDGVLVEIFKKQWGQLSDGKPIVVSAHLVESVNRRGLREIWKEFDHWKEDVKDTLSGNERLFSTELNGQTVWVIDEGVAYILMYPEDY
jgi:hypothetical protein